MVGKCVGLLLTGWTGVAPLLLQSKKAYVLHVKSTFYYASQPNLMAKPALGYAESCSYKNPRHPIILFLASTCYGNTGLTGLAAEDVLYPLTLSQCRHSPFLVLPPL